MVSEETRHKRSEYLKARWRDPEYRQKMSSMAKLTWQHPEYRNKMSEVSKHNWQNPSYRDKLHSAESARKISEKAKVRCRTPEGLARMQRISALGVQVAKQKQIYQNPQFRHKLSKALKRKWADPEYRRRQLEANVRSHQTEEYKQSASKIHKLLWQNPQYRNKVVHGKKRFYKKHPEARQKASERLKVRFALGNGMRRGPVCEEERKQIVERNRLHRHSAETKWKISEHFKKLWQNDDYKRKMSEIRKKLPQTLKRKESLRKAHEALKRHKVSTKTRAKISEIRKHNWEDPIYRRKKSAYFASDKGKEHLRKFRRAGKVRPSRAQRWLHNILVDRGFYDAYLEMPLDVSGHSYSLDVALPSVKVDIEYDGHYWHSINGNAEHDRQRDIILNMAGWEVIRVPERTTRTLEMLELCNQLEAEARMQIIKSQLQRVSQ
jgi:very-short-patch-repair endonuclease